MHIRQNGHLLAERETYSMADGPDLPLSEPCTCKPSIHSCEHMAVSVSATPLAAGDGRRGDGACLAQAGPVALGRVGCCRRSRPLAPGLAAACWPAACVAAGVQCSLCGLVPGAQPQHAAAVCMPGCPACLMRGGSWYVTLSTFTAMHLSLQTQNAKSLANICLNSLMSGLPYPSYCGSWT